MEDAPTKYFTHFTNMSASTQSFIVTWEMLHLF